MTDHKLDLDRYTRTGLHEAVLCSGKSPAQLHAILQTCSDAGRSMLMTRLSPVQYEALSPWQGQLDYDPVSATAVLGRMPSRGDTPRVALVTGGSADLGVAREALRTLQFHGVSGREFTDIGVAGLWRLQEVLPELETFEVIIACAGMDAALPTVLGGLVSGLVVAVPVSSGYGTARGGETALNALLCSCAQGLVVVNIDNGFGAACAALRVLKR